jgi:hypothetical protein
MADQEQTPAATASEGTAPRRSTARRIACTIDLGWRVASLYSLAATASAGGGGEYLDGVLPTHERLGASQRLAVEVKAAAGDAEHAGAPLSDAQFEELLAAAETAAASADGEEDFKQLITDWHLRLEQELWCRHEARGRAYELGNFLSDTWNRAVRSDEEPHLILQRLFNENRVARIKQRIDDLQARLDPAAAEVVTSHLDTWRERVLEVEDRLRPMRVADGVPYEPLRRQTIIWRQLLTGDKEPEAYLDREDRARVRTVMTKEMWRRYRGRAWLLIPIGLLGGLVTWLVAADTNLAAGAAGVIGSVAAALGLTRASIGLAIRNALSNWSELMWNRSLTAVICERTLTFDDLLVEEPAPAGVLAHERLPWRPNGAKRPTAKDPARRSRDPVGSSSR